MKHKVAFATTALLLVGFTIFGAAFFVKVSAVAGGRHKILCKVSEGVFKEEVRWIFEQAIDRFLQHERDQLPLPERYEEIVRFGHDYREQLARDARYTSAHPGDLGAVDSDILLNAQDWADTWEVESVLLKFEKDHVLASVSFRDRAGKFEFKDGPVRVKFACEEGEFVVVDTYFKGTDASRPRAIKKELDNLGQP